MIKVAQVVSKRQITPFSGFDTPQKQSKTWPPQKVKRLTMDNQTIVKLIPPPSKPTPPFREPRSTYQGLRVLAENDDSSASFKGWRLVRKHECPAVHSPRGLLFFHLAKTHGKNVQ